MPNVVHTLQPPYESCWGFLQEEGYLGPSLGDDVLMTLSIIAVLAGVSAVLLIAAYYLSTTRLFQRATLTTVLTKQRGYTSPGYSAGLIGAQGITQTPLRPSGKVQIKEGRYEAKTLGTYIPPNNEIVVIGIEGASLVVQALA